jgi:LuxR family transcriptional regulator, maltose regulon positive regulatory protein
MPRVALYHCLGQTKLAQGDIVAASEAMARGDETSRRPSVTPAFRGRHAAYRVLFCIRTKDQAGMEEWGRRIGEYAPHLGLEFHSVPPRLLIAQGQIELAREQLGRVYEKTVETGAHGLGITVRVYQSLAASTQEEALSFLSDALVKGEAAGYIRTFVDEGQLLSPLLRKALSQGISPHYASMLLATIQAEAQRRNPKQTEGPSPQSILSDRELEIMRLLENGLPNAAIAERLVISLATVKTHIHNISRKLEANNRSQAVAKAREMKLM